MESKNFSSLCSDYNLEWHGPNWITVRKYTLKSLFFQLLCKYGVAEKYKGDGSLFSSGSKNMEAYCIGNGGFVPKPIKTKGKA